MLWNMLGLGLPEIMILLLIVVLLFGARKLPEIGRGLGSGMREFKEGVTGKDDEPSTTPATPELTTPAVQSPPVVHQPAEEQASSDPFTKKDAESPRDAG
jgi:sec-independent protein translocase protein TatA